MMLFKLITYILIFFSSGSLIAQDTLKIEASLNHERRRIKGVVEYRIPSGLKSDHIEFQLFANADISPFASNSVVEGIHGTEIDSAVIGGSGISLDIDVVRTSATFTPTDKITLPGKIIKVFFTTYMQSTGDRLTYTNENYLLDGWFPYPALLTDNGDWYNPDYGPYSELVSDFFYYDVKFECPENQVVAAPVAPASTETGATSKFYTYSFGPAHDFAMALSPEFVIDSSVVGKTELFIYHLPSETPVLPRIRDAVGRTFEFMEAHLGEYAYDRFSVVMSHTELGGGIEFPAMTAITPFGGRMANSHMYESLIIHETIHQWFYGMINSDQSKAPWMDESITNYFTLRILEENYGAEANLIDLFGFKGSQRDEFRLSANVTVSDNPAACPADKFSSDVEFYGAIYNRGSLIIETFNNLLDDSLSNLFWSEYFDRYSFKQPTTYDFYSVVEDVTDSTMADVLKKLLEYSGPIDYSIKKFEHITNDSTGYKLELTLKKTGPINIPIDYYLIDSNDDTLKYVWTPEYNTEKITLDIDNPIMTVIVDPENKITVDANLLNNSYLYNPDNGPGMRLSSGIMFLIESLLSFLGGM